MIAKQNTEERTVCIIYQIHHPLSNEGALKLKAARDAVGNDFEGSVKCDLIRCIDEPWEYQIFFKEAEEGKLEEALKMYISLAGLPKHISGSSDLDACNRVLAEQGKTLSRGYDSHIWNIGKKIEKTSPKIVSLEELTNIKGEPSSVYKRDLYRAIAGEDPDCFATPVLNIKRKDVEKIYRAVKKMQERERYNIPGDPYTKYYAPCFAKIEQAYNSNNLKKFKRAVSFLLTSIAWD